MAKTMHMKRSMSLFRVVAGILMGVVSARADRSTSVAALVNLTNCQVALLVITDSPPDAAFVNGTHQWVAVGQEFDDLYLQNKQLHVIIREIDFTNGTVRAAENGHETLYVPTSTNMAAAAYDKNLLLSQVDFSDAIDLYALLKGRMVLVHPNVQPSPLTVWAKATNSPDAVAILEQALCGKGTEMIADGEKFEWIVPVGTTNLTPPAAFPVRPDPKSLSTNADDNLSAGSINFAGTDLPQALAVYQALTSRKWVRGSLPAGGITLSFHNQLPLTKNEMLHVFDVVLAWHGLKVTNLDDKSFKLVPLAAGP